MAKTTKTTKTATTTATKGAVQGAPLNAPVSKEMASLVAQVGGNVAATLPAIKLTAKSYIRQALADSSVALTLEQMIQASGHNEVTLRTMLSDLRSPKYAGKAGVFHTVGIKRADGKTYYQRKPD